MKTETAVKSFKKCDISSNPLNGTEDDILFEDSDNSDSIVFLDLKIWMTAVISQDLKTEMVFFCMCR